MGMLTLKTYEELVRLMKADFFNTHTNLNTHARKLTLALESKKVEIQEVKHFVVLD